MHTRAATPLQCTHPFLRFTEYFLHLVNLRCRKSEQVIVSTVIVSTVSTLSTVIVSTVIVSTVSTVNTARLSK